MRKKVLFILLLIVGIFLPSQELEVQAEGDLLEEVQERGYVRVGTASGFSPFEFTIIDENGDNQIVGVDIFLAEKIAEDLGVDLQIVDMEFGNLISSMETGGIDMILSGMTATEERRKNVDFTVPYYKGEQKLIVREEDKDKYGDIYDVLEAGDTLAISADTLQETLAREIFPDDQLLSMRKSADAVVSLQAGQADAVLQDDAVAGAFAAENEGLVVIPSGLDVSEEGSAAAVPKNQENFLNAVNQSVQEAVDQGLIDQYLEESYAIIEGQQESAWSKYAPYFWDGTKTTLLISVVSIIFGSILGAILAFMRISDNSFLSSLATAYIEFVRGTPLMTQVLFIFLTFGSYFGVGSLGSGLVSVSLNSGAYIAEIIRGGINSVDKGQSEAAKALGMSKSTTMRKIIIPQSLRSIWPSLGNEFISLIKESSIVSTIGVAELTFQTRSVTNLTYQGVIPLLISMGIYFVLTFFLSKVMTYFEGRMNKAYA